MNTFEVEVKSGERFQFGKNWQRFLSTFTDDRIRTAEKSLIAMLGTDDLRGKTFLDIGSGSGLFSLAARNLGASVHSFDYDPDSVSCTRHLRSRFYHDDPNWNVEEGSVIDSDFLQSLGTFDIVYAWGVLHHTGDMWSAIDNAASLVKHDGLLFIALYNDTGFRSRLWRRVKKCYCSGIASRSCVSLIVLPYFFVKALLQSLRRRQNVFSSYKRRRGMSITHDWFDWLGGYPYEFATVDDVFHFLQAKGFLLINIKTENGGLGNNEFVFVRKYRPMSCDCQHLPKTSTSHCAPPGQFPGESS